MQVAIVGGGVMGEAMLAAALERGIFVAADVTIAEILEPRREELRAAYGVSVVPTPGEATGTADLVVLSVKPQDAKSARGSLKPGALLLSVMAGVRLATLTADFAHPKVVRVMPNTPVAAKAGMSVWTATAEVTAEQRRTTQSLLESFGREIYVEDEKKIDMATALSGSGPAYVFLVIEAMVEGGVAVGLPRAQAQEMAIQTVLGSALYAQESGRDPAVLRGQVTSPAGTTAAGLLELEKGAMRATIIKAIRAAHRRAVELGGPA